jgi:hypothetical protein
MIGRRLASSSNEVRSVLNGVSQVSVNDNVHCRKARLTFHEPRPYAAARETNL